MTSGDDALPEAAQRRLTSGAFSSGLSTPDFAACLTMGLRPVGLVQGFCVMRWSWYGAGSMFGSGMTPYASGAGAYGQSDYTETYQCPHGFVSAEHRRWGQNYEQPWVEQAWAQGFGAAYQRLLEEAAALGAHGVIGVSDSTRQLTDMAVTEFHILGTAVVLEGSEPPPGSRPWTTYLAGQRLAKLVEAGFMPVSVVATMTSVRVWASCVTQYLTEGGNLMWASATVGPQEIDQLVRAHSAVRQLARRRAGEQLGSDTLHGARMATSTSHLGEGDEVVECMLRGTRVRRFKDFDPVDPPRPTVRLS